MMGGAPRRTGGSTLLEEKRISIPLSPCPHERGIGGLEASIGSFQGLVGSIGEEPTTSRTLRGTGSNID